MTNTRRTIRHGFRERRIGGMFPMTVRPLHDLVMVGVPSGYRDGVSNTIALSVSEARRAACALNDAADAIERAQEGKDRK